MHGALAAGCAVDAPKPGTTTRDHSRQAGVSCMVILLVTTAVLMRHATRDGRISAGTWMKSS